MKKFALLLLLPIIGKAQIPSYKPAVNFIQQHKVSMLEEFMHFLAIPNIASDKENILRNANWIMAAMKQRGINDVSLLYPKTKNAPPAVYGEVITPGATETIIFYAHYDGQPVDTTKWATGLHPFKPVLLPGIYDDNAKTISIQEAIEHENARIYARGASDDKAGVMAIINAYGALKASGINPTVNIKFFFEGEEEAGSPHLHEIMELYANKLQSNMWVICDGPLHQSGRKQVVFGVRGDTHVEVTVFASKRPLHSGHYGNWAPNPAMQLSKLLSSMKDDNGKVLIKDFYSDITPLLASEKEALRKIPNVDQQVMDELGFIKPENSSWSLADAVNMPSLNINGIQSANVGKLAANVIPTKAIASIDLRLVVGNDWQKQQQKVVNHIKAQGFFVTDREPTDEQRKKYSKIAMVALSSGYNAQKTSMDNPFAKRIVKAVATTSVDPIITTPTLGGSLPLFIFEKYLNTKPISVPIANHDNNQHAENENLKLSNFWKGIETFMSIMTLQK
ncbi:MAG: M20/M25/M40 family metallo-hydrolase [Chitinophagaceae bacterium]|nr:M20/M25/M40 family metallo-hydrolase [Chitinophagaceae bacterium]